MLICFCLPCPLNSECLEGRTELYPCVSAETVLAIFKANKFNKYRSELNELEFKSNQGPACHYWLWCCLTVRPSLAVLAYPFFIYKERVSYLPFRDAVKMHLTMPNCTLICEGLLLDINCVHRLPFKFFFCSYKVLQHRRTQVKEGEGDALCHVHTQWESASRIRGGLYLARKTIARSKKINWVT